MLALKWLNEIGLFEERKDTGVLVTYPLAVKINVVEQVVCYFDKEYTKACSGITDLAHLKWTLESTGAAFTLPLPACEEVIAKTIQLYKTWLKEPTRRHPVLVANFTFLADELVKHLSLLFQRRVHPDSQANRDIHAKLCTEALDLFGSLGHHTSVDSGSPRRCGPSVPEDFALGSLVEAHSLVKSNELNGRIGKVIGYAEGRVLVNFSNMEPHGLRLENLKRNDHSLTPDNWETIIKVILGICDFTINTGAGMKELEYMLLSILFEALLRSKIFSDSLWYTISRLVANWTNSMATARQWFAAAKALTLSIHSAMQKSDEPLATLVKTLPSTRVCITWEALPKGFRKVTEIDMTAEEAMMCWRRFLHLIGDPNKMEAKVCSQTMQGIRGVSLLLSYCGWYTTSKTASLLPQPSPSAESLFALIGDWLMGSIFHQSSDPLRKDAKATALTILTDVYLKPHQTMPDFAPFLMGLKSSAEQATEPLTCEQAVVYRYRVLTACMRLFTYNIPELHSLLPSFVALLSRVIKYPEVRRGISARFRRDASIPLHVEDYDTDDEFDGLLVERDPDMEYAGNGQPMTFHSDPDENDTDSPHSQDLPKRSSPTHKNREGSLLDGSDTKTRHAGLTMLAAVIPFTLQFSRPPKLRSDVRVMLMRALSSETEPRNLSTVLQLCVQWIHCEMERIDVSQLAGIPSNMETIEENDPFCQLPESVLATAAHIISEVQLLLEGIQGWARQTVEVYFAAIKTIQHGALPFCSSVTSWPSPEHGSRGALLAVDPSMPCHVTSSLAKFILYLHGKQNKEFTEAGISMLCNMTLSALSEWITHCPSITSNKETIKEVMDAVDIALGMKNAESLAVPSAALSVFWSCMCNPYYPPNPVPERAHVSSTVSEEHLASCQSKRYFALDGTKILTILNHTEAKEDDALLHKGGVTSIIRDAFGRHVWDARLHLGRVEGEGVRPKPNTMISRRHGISLGPERSNTECAPTESTLEDAFEPLVAGLPEVEMDEVAMEMKKMLLDSKEEGQDVFDSIPPMEEPKGREEPDQARLFLTHLQLLTSSERIVELKDSPDLRSALAMIDATPSRELHRFSVVYLHDEDGTASLQDLGVEWYLSQDSKGFNSPELPNLSDFTGFIGGLGWPIDPSEHPQAYSGGSVGEKWRRQRLPYYADTQCEAVWAVSAATPSSLEKILESHSGERWEDKTPVRIIWNDTATEVNPSALSGCVVEELERYVPTFSCTLTFHTH
eukprot:TRINITY_DN19869_c0_g1_i3.p1 TRINITY_DN19869_c0_g1~~TRINITY_DN19869_c0_g1_i3.p1  ORF type:complete len:1242 (+),score=270.96 TRINITY_DN19869_c0_g1_i3:141-3866(+)